MATSTSDPTRADTTTDPGDWRHRDSELRAALGIAAEFLARWTDPVTESERDNLHVEVAVLAVQGWHRLRDKACFAAYVRTIARRRRARLVRQRKGQTRQGRARFQELRHDPVQPVTEPPCYAVAGRWLRRRDMVAVLPDLLARLDPFNVQLLMGFYEGFSCAELAGRFDVSLDVVKVRVHRTRRQVKGLFEILAHDRAGELRVGELPVRRPRKEPATGRQPRHDPQRRTTCDDGSDRPWR